MIVVTGATGQLGRLVVESLLTRVPATGLAVSVRDPDKAKDFAARGVRVRRGDFTDAVSLKQSLEGATQVLLISSNAAAYGGDTLAQHRLAIDAIKASGARRVVYTSQMAANVKSHFAPAVHHAQTEEMIGASGLKWTSLRNGFYATAAIRHLGQAVATGTLRTTPTGKCAWTTHVDLADAAAAVLVNEGQFEGPTPPLTARQAVDFTELCTIASELLGRPIRHDVVTEEQLSAALAAAGSPPQVARISIGMFRAANAGEFSAIDPTLEKLIGRQPATIREAMAEHFRK
ncbi:MAG: NAD(P)H-binding protein [Archangium sp.]